ncbi:MAG: hypothetical protein GY913_05045 [Proteobacteria bacterium]|nr:hypothetical protein [Pseudomonadota bacterium]MCP4916267.1 hypothetical protein [Pseudomonadota bacterium]
MDRLLHTLALVALVGNAAVVLGVGASTAMNVGDWMALSEVQAVQPALDAQPIVSGPVHEVDCATLKGHLMDAAQGLAGDYTARVEALGDDCAAGDEDVELLRSAIRDRFLMDGAKMPPSLSE